jgi:ABC-2 type transport system permease protein
MRRFRALIKKEMIYMLRNPRTLVFIFLMPILQLVLLGYANNTEIRNMPTVVFNQDNSIASRVLLDLFNSTDYFSFDYAVYSQAEVSQLIDSGKVKVGIVIPPDYGRNLSTRQNRRGS